MACSWGNNHEQLNNFPLFSQAPQLGDVVHLGSDPVHQQHDNGLISDHVLIYSKDCFSCRIGEQHCVAAEGEAEMCQIKGKKYRVIFLTGPPLKMSLDCPPPNLLGLAPPKFP